MNQVNAHNDTITSLNWVSVNQILTTSLDHTMHIYNADRMIQVWNVNFKDSAVTASDYGQMTSLILTGHEDGNIRVFDEKERNKVAVKLCKSHVNWISD